MVAANEEEVSGSDGGGRLVQGRVNTGSAVVTAARKPDRRTGRIARTIGIRVGIRTEIRMRIAVLWSRHAGIHSISLV